METINEDEYEELLDAKVKRVCKLLEDHLSEDNIREMTVIESPKSHFRHRCKFTIVHESVENVETGEMEDTAHYAMWEGGTPSVRVDSFPVASPPIFEIMPLLLAFIHLPANKELLFDLQAVHFLSTLIGEVVVSLVYGSLREGGLQSTVWCPAGFALRDHLLLHSNSNSISNSNSTTTISDININSNSNSNMTTNTNTNTNTNTSCVPLSLPSVTAVSVLGRSKGVKLVCGVDYVHETFHLHMEEEGDKEGDIGEEKKSFDREVKYVQVEEGFSNPNAEVNRRALGWICSCVVAAAASATASAAASSCITVPRRHNLLEMFCGNGNHTMAIAGA